MPKPVDWSTALQKLRMPSLQGLALAEPRALLLLIPVGLLLLYGLWQADGPRRWLAPILRTLTLVLFVLALTQPQAVSHSEGLTRPVVIDVSASITPAMRAYTVALLRDQLKLRDRDPALLFAGGTLNTTVGDAVKILEGSGCSACQPEATNLENALNLIAADPAAHDGPIALVTDGWETRGNVAAVSSTLRAAGIQLYVFTPPGAASIPNVAMTQMTLPTVLDKAGAFTLDVTLNNLNAGAAGGVITL